MKENASNIYPQTMKVLNEDVIVNNFNEELSVIKKIKRLNGEITDTIN